MNPKGKMITPFEEEFILTKAYVPEHIVSLMVLISNGEPFLVDDYLGFSKDNWIVLIGYPLGRNFSIENCEKVVARTVSSHRPDYLWFIGPEIPPSLLNSCTERQKDQYYTLKIDDHRTKGSLRRVTEKALLELNVERGHAFLKAHEALVKEFLKREKLPQRVRELYLAMPRYVSLSKSALVLNAWDRKGALSSFYILDLAAKDFTTYLLGCHSRDNYVPHASDLLFSEMIQLSVEAGKRTIHLGLGVNEGIRRFKEKWGGTPYLRYEFCEIRCSTTRIASLVRDLAGKL